MSIQPFDNELFAERSEVALKTKLDTLIETSLLIVIDSEERFNKVTALYAESRVWEDRIENARKQSNQGDQDRIKARNNRAKELIEPLKKIQQITQDKASKYQEYLEDLKRKEVALMEDTIDLLGLGDIPYIPPDENKHRGTGASMYTKIVKKFKVIDFDKIPSDYKILDEDKIDKALKLGINEIPGIEVYEEKVTQLRRL